MRQSSSAPERRWRGTLYGGFSRSAVRHRIAAEAVPVPLTAATLGREIFLDPSLSASGRIDETGIVDLIAFLETLTDGYDPAIDTADPARNLSSAP